MQNIIQKNFDCDGHRRDFPSTKKVVRLNYSPKIGKVHFSDPKQRLVNFACFAMYTVCQIRDCGVL